MQATNEQIERAQWWIKTWACHQSQLTKEVALEYAKQTMDVEVADLELAAREWARGSRKAPMPCDLNPDKSKAEQAAQNVWQCLHWKNWPKRKDNMNYLIPDEAEVYKAAGPMSTAIMLRHGGFHAMLKKIHDYDEHWTKKNWTEEAIQIMRNVRSGVEQLPEPSKVQVEGEKVLKLVHAVEKGGPRGYFEED